MNNQKWWTAGSTSSGHSWSLTHGWEHSHTTESFQGSGIHPWWLLRTRWLQHGRWQRGSIHCLIPAQHFATQSSSVGDPSPVLRWSIFPSPQPWLCRARPAHSHAAQGHLTHVYFKYREVILSTVQLSDAQPIRLIWESSVGYSQHLSRSLTKIENQKDLGAILV